LTAAVIAPRPGGPDLKPARRRTPRFASSTGVAHAEKSSALARPTATHLPPSLRPRPVTACRVRCREPPDQQPHETKDYPHVVNLRRARAWSHAAHRTGIAALVGTGRREGSLCQPAACSSPWPRTLCLGHCRTPTTPGCSLCPIPGESSRRVAGDIHMLSTPMCMRLQTCLLRCRAASHPLIQTGSVANEATPMSALAPVGCQKSVTCPDLDVHVRRRPAMKIKRHTQAQPPAT
jgi:hypothetical protein